MPIKLSDKFIQHAKPPTGKAQLDVWDTLLPGFGVRVGKRRKTFVAMVRVGGVKRRITLGEYDAETFPLARARAKAREAMETAGRGDDPNRVVEQERAARDTVSKLVAEFIDKHAKPNNRDWKKQEGIFELDVLPHWKNREVRSITRRDCIELLDKAAERTSPVTANRVRAHANKFFNWLVGRDVLDANPMLSVPPPGRERKRDRTLSDDEIRLVWQCSGDAGHPFGAIFKLLLVTGQRRDEVGTMRWSDIDETKSIWTVPKEISKNGVANEVPLPKLALEILGTVDRIDGEMYVFPAANGSGKPASGYSKAKSRLDRAIAKKRADAKEEPMPPWWLHDLRRTCASDLARLGIAPHVIEKILNHTTGQLGGVAGVYNRHAYLPEKRHALEAWAAHLGRILEPAPNVFPLAARQR